MLEYHTHLLPVDIDVHLDLLSGFGILVAFLGNVNTMEDNLPFIQSFQQIHTPQQGALAGAGGADDGHHVPLVDIHGNIVQGVESAFVVGFPDMFYLNQLIVCRHGSSSFQSAESPSRWGRSDRNKCRLLQSGALP